MASADPAAALAGGAVSRPRNPARRLVLRLFGVWRRNLQLRVVVTTLLLGALTVSLISISMYRNIADGLTSDRRASAQAETQQLVNEAQATVDTVADPNTTTLDSTLADVGQLLGSPSGEGARQYLIVKGLDNSEAMTLPTRADGLAVNSIPDALRQAVVADPETQQVTMIQVPRTAGGGTVPAVLVGSTILVPTAGTYELYLLYPMDSEQATLEVITRSFLLGSASLLLLVSAVAYMVTRTVVTPVRRAAAAASRLADGDLNERMSARGEDDLAKLGQSFNGMADNLQTQIRQLEGLSRVQQRFVSDVSHELRTPLTTIRMAVDVIHASRDELDPSMRRPAELLSTELDRFEALLADLLEISRYDAGAAILEQEPVDFVPMTQRVIQSAESIARARGSDVRFHGPGPGVAVAEVDVRRVERILRNLVVNAIEHGEGEPIDVWLDAGEDAVAVVVEDRGVGLRAGEASLVFNRFWRADPARARTTGGTGLGLAIALEDARLHHGWLQAWGEPGTGSRFRLTLPREAGGTIRSAPLPLTPREGDLAVASTEGTG